MARALQISSLLSVLSVAAAQTPVTVQTLLGPVAGTLQSADATSIDAIRPSVETFFGIPYAEPPIGKLRFAPAKPKPAWGPSVIKAQAYGNACHQDGAAETHSEDCLFLNIWRKPGTQAGAQLPVMFWIHGGAFTSGSGSGANPGKTGNYYDGTFLSTQHGVIVVTINYRLGPFGFLGVQGGVGVGTGHLNGLYDQIVALQWVHDNIAAFGGDPSKVTVFGESAGSLSICMLCVSPLASGLFVRAIMESGACTYDSYWGAYDETDESDSPTAADLQAMSVVDVMALPGGGPALDGWVLSKHPFDMMDERGRINPDSVLLGGNSFDGLTPWLPEIALPNTYMQWRETMLVLLGGNGFSISSAWDIMAQYPVDRYLSTADGSPYYRAAMAQCDGDLAVVCPTKWLHQKLGQLGTEARMYYFEYGPSCSDMAGMQWGDASPYATAGGWASHASEISYVFGSKLDTDGAVCDPMTESEASYRLSTVMQQLWTSFAKTGKPFAEASLFTGPVDETEQWPMCGPDATIGDSSNEPVMVLGATTIGVVRGHKDDDCQLMHEHVHASHSNLWPFVQGMFFVLVIGGGAAAAVHLGKLPDPRKLPEPASCEMCARGSTAATVVAAAIAALVPFIAPYGQMPLMMAICCACALLLRHPHVMIGAGVCSFFFGIYITQMLVVFSMASSSIGENWGSHSFSSTVAAFTSVVLMLLNCVLPCSYCLAARGVMKQDTTVLVPMMPMGAADEEKAAGGPP